MTGATVARHVGSWFRAAMQHRVAGALAALLLGAAGCHHEVPAPAYPSPVDPPLEETDLYQYFESADESADDDWEEEDEGWNDAAEDEGWNDEPTDDTSTAPDGIAPEPAP
jgi:hypothetical protein